MVARTTKNNKLRPNVVLVSLSMAAMVAASRPSLLTKVYAAENQYEWTKQDEVDRLGGYYSSAAQSADGSTLILGVNNGGENGAPETWVESPLYISQNGGTSWQNIATEIDPGIQNSWESVDVSNDGQVMVASSDNGHNIDEFAGEPGKIFVSNDGGDTWVNKTPAETDEWDNIVVSGDGEKIAAIEASEDVVYITENGGDNWTTSSIPDTWELKSLSISDAGKIFVGGESSNDANTHLYSTEDNGTNWVDISPDEVDDELSGDYIAAYNSHDVSSNGQKVVLAANMWDSREIVFISNDSGATWTEADPDPEVDVDWQAAAISDDGSTISVISNGVGGKMFITTDNGESWTEEAPGQDYDDTNSYWRSLDMNEDGTKFIVANEESTYLNGAMTPDPEVSSTVTLSDAEGGKTVTVTTPDGTTITCHSAVKESVLTVQDAGYQYPLGLVDFCFSGADTNNQVSLIFVTDLKPNEVAVRKYNPSNNAYATITDASVTQTTYEGKAALLVSYNIVDNGPLDTDSDVGEVADPVGLGVLGVNAPNTGLKKAK